MTITEMMRQLIKIWLEHGDLYIYLSDHSTDELGSIEVKDDSKIILRNEYYINPDNY
jgi:hypothetical protein